MFFTKTYKYFDVLLSTLKNIFTQLFSGLTIGATVVQGEYGKMYAESQAARVSLRQVINSECVKGFPEVVVGDNISDCICHM